MNKIEMYRKRRILEFKIKRPIILIMLWRIDRNFLCEIPGPTRKSRSRT